MATQSWKSLNPIRNKIVLGTILPFIVTSVIFVSALFFVIIPMTRRIHIDKEKLAVRNLVLTVWQTLDFYHSLAASGVITEEQARDFAREHIRNLRYGSDMQNYFWIIDMRGNVVLNPYSSNLEGMNHSMLRDIDGKYFIQEFIEAARQDDGAFVQYKWQFMGSPGVIEDKVSFVRRYRKWDWVVGTGLYLDEVNRSVGLMSTGMVLLTFMILMAISAMSFYVVRNFMKSERVRSKITSEARRTESKIRQMINSVPEMLLRIDKDCVVLDVKEPLNFEPFIEPGKLLGSSISQWPEGAVEKCQAAIRSVFEKSNPETVVFDIDRGNGEIFSFEAVFAKCGKTEVLASIRRVSR